MYNSESYPSRQPSGQFKNVLVTGAGGFIGSHLCENLLRRGHRITAIDSMDGPNRWIKEKNILSIAKNPNCLFIRANLLDADLSSLLESIDVVFHLAATPGVRTCWGSNFSPYLDNNIMATQVLLEAAKDYPLKKFVLASTSSIYGSVQGPTDEEYRPNPLSPYGVTKLAAEHLALIYQREFSLPLTTIRYFTVYGPRQRPDMAFHRFIKSMLSGTDITVYGDGNQMRDFTYVTDAVEATILAMSSPVHGNVFNAGSSTRTSVNEIIWTMANITERKAKIIYQPAQPGEPKETWADIGKITRELGYLPRTNLEEGLRAEVAYIKDLYQL